MECLIQELQSSAQLALRHGQGREEHQHVPVEPRGERQDSVLQQTLEDPAVRKRIEETGSLVVGNSPAEFTEFMTFLAPAPRLPIDPNINLQGGTVFNRIGCAQCHLLRDYVTPSRPANGVPGNFSFRPRTDFLVHDIGTGDGIGNDGDSVATTNRIRTAPLWGLHHRTLFLHDGSATSIEGAIARHGNQAAASRAAFNNLNSSDRAAMLAAMRSD